MGVLLPMFQKLRLIREKNQLTLELTRDTGKLDRIVKNIERTQKRYTSLFAQLDAKAKQMQSQASLAFQQMSGLGMNNFANSLNPYSFSGMNGFIYSVMQKAFDSSSAPQGANFQEMYSEYMGNGGRFVAKKDGSGYENFNEEQVKAFNYAMQQAQMQQQQAQYWVQNANQQYGNNVSIWLDVAKAQLEAEQDAALEPLSYQETMLELSKEQKEARLERINAQIETYDRLCSEEAKNSAPTFGLG